MRSFRACVGVVLGLGVLLPILVAAAAPNTALRHARLSPVPMDATMRGLITGIGKVTAVRHGTAVVVNGDFEGLRSPATLAEVHLARMAGIRGPAIAKLQVAHAESGTIAGSFELSADQLDSYRNGGCYLEIFSEKAPDGNLWGWLLP